MRRSVAQGLWVVTRSDLQRLGLLPHRLSVFELRLERVELEFFTLTPVGWAIPLQLVVVLATCPVWLPAGGRVTPALGFVFARPRGERVI